MFLFVIGFMPSTSCILIFLFIVVCRGGRGSFVSMWVVDRCASPQMLEVSFQHVFSNVSGLCHEHIMLLCVCFTSGFVLSVPAMECVHG